jgi:hypothetical protein
MEHDKQCVLVIIGADERGHKDIIGSYGQKLVTG